MGTLERRYSPTAPEQEGESGSHNWIFFHPTGLRETCISNTALMAPKKYRQAGQNKHTQQKPSKAQGKGLNAAPRPVGGRSKGEGPR